MSSFFGSKKITARYIGKKAIIAIYRGTRLIWSAITSCFGAGFWKNDESWSNDDGWANK